MKNLKTALLYGFLIWLFVFAVAFMIFPIHESNRVFFESIMPVAISVATAFFSFKYLRRIENHFVKEGLLLGFVFMLLNWALDAAFMLTPSPMQMTLADYIQDIGFTYLMILPITLGFGYIEETINKRSEN